MRVVMTFMLYSEKWQWMGSMRKGGSGVMRQCIVHVCRNREAHIGSQLGHRVYRVRITLC
jgi:hypothetical protein